MQNPRNLRAYGEARKIANLTYRLTRRFPREELFGMSAQMRRAAISIGSNIAEGCGRQGNRALIAFLHNSLGSASELEFQLEVAVDVGLCGDREAAPLGESIEAIKRMLSRLIVSLRQRPDTPS